MQAGQEASLEPRGAGEMPARGRERLGCPHTGKPQQWQSSRARGGAVSRGES